MLPGCQCENCKRWVEARADDPLRLDLTSAEYRSLNAAYKAHRAAWQEAHPIRGRDDV